MSIIRWGHSAILLENGTVLVAGGSGPAGDGVYTPRTEIYDPVENEWRSAGNLNTPRGFHAATRLANGNVLVAAGLTLNSITTTAEMFNPVTGTWTLTGSMAFERIPGPYGSVLLQNGEAFVAGGRTQTSESYKAETGTWTIRANLNIPRSFHTVTRLSNGTVLTVGGENRNGFTSSVELYNPPGMEFE
jgi:N-acetylneuraminic acid mutarotase